MIIPIRCFTCNKVLANRWKEFEKEWMQPKQKKNPPLVTIIDQTFLNDPNAMNAFTPKQILDDLDITRVCCRKHFYHVFP